MRLFCLICLVILGALPLSLPASAQELSEDDISRQLGAPLARDIDDLDYDHTYSVDEVKRNWRIRRHMPNVDLNTINFAFDSSNIPYEERRKLRKLARALHRFLDRNPYEIFLIEGHTDATGSAGYNRHLSNKRAHEVRNVLIEFFDVPARALDVIGYGEEFLLIQTPSEEWRNRRVTVRRLTEIVSRPLSREDRLEDDTYYDLDDLPRSSVTVN